MHNKRKGGAGLSGLENSMERGREQYKNYWKSLSIARYIYVRVHLKQEKERQGCLSGLVSPLIFATIGRKGRAANNVKE